MLPAEPTASDDAWEFELGLSGFLAGLDGTATVGDVSADVEWFGHDRERAWLHSYDPTLISPRLVTELNYQDRSSDRSLLKLETTLRYGFGLNAKFDTASEPQLGADAFILRPTTAIRWDVTKHLNVGIQAEYSFTPSDEGDDDVSALELKFPIAVKVSQNWSGALTYKPRWDFLDDADRHRIEFGATRVWGPNHEYSLFFKTELPLSSQSLDWKVATGFAWYF